MMDTIDILNKMDSSLDYAIKCAKNELKTIKPDTPDYYKKQGEIEGLKVPKTMIHLVKSLGC